MPPPVPSVNPQWPFGGPAADQAPSLAEIEAACPGAPADFLLAQVRAKATPAAAQAAWQFLKGQIPAKPKGAAEITPEQPPASSASSLLLPMLVALFGGQLLQLGLPLLQRWQAKAATTPNPFDDLISGFVRKVLEDRLTPPTTRPTTVPPANQAR